MIENKRPLKVFLCHAHADRDSVRTLYSRLKREGVDAWLDKEKLLPGSDWELEIRKAVREADVVVVCLSKQFNQAGFRQKEVRIALDTAMEKPEGEIFIIPARLEECESLDSLNKWHWVDLFETDGYQSLIRALRARADRIGATLRIRSGRQSVTSHLKSKESENTNEPLVISTDINDVFLGNAINTEMRSTLDQEEVEHEMLDKVAQGKIESEAGERIEVDEFALKLSKENMALPLDSLEKQKLASVAKTVTTEEQTSQELEPVNLSEESKSVVDDKNLLIPTSKSIQGLKPANAKPAPKRKPPIIVLGVIGTSVLSIVFFFIFGTYLYNLSSNVNKPTLLPLQDYFTSSNISQLNIELGGQATNATVNKASGITLNIKSTDGVDFSANGAFDNVNLVGRIETTGTQVECVTNGIICLEFKGKVYFGGNDGGNYPEGTEADFSMYLIVDQNSVTGTYIVGVIPNSVSWTEREQNGTLSLLPISAVK